MNQCVPEQCTKFPNCELCPGPICEFCSPGYLMSFDKNECVPKCTNPNILNCDICTDTFCEKCGLDFVKNRLN